MAGPPELHWSRMSKATQAALAKMQAENDKANRAFEAAQKADAHAQQAHAHADEAMTKYQKASGDSHLSESRRAELVRAATNANHEADQADAAARSAHKVYEAAAHKASAALDDLDHLRNKEPEYIRWQHEFKKWEDNQIFEQRSELDPDATHGEHDTQVAMAATDGTDGVLGDEGMHHQTVADLDGAPSSSADAFTAAHDESSDGLQPDGLQAPVEPDMTPVGAPEYAADDGAFQQLDPITADGGFVEPPSDDDAVG